LDVGPPGPGETHDETFAAEECRLPVPDLLHLVLDAILPADHVAGIDDIGRAGSEVDGVDGAVARHDEVTGTRALQHDEAFLAEERLGSTPLAVNVDRTWRGKVGARLEVHGLVVERPGDDVARQCRCNDHVRVGSVGREGVHEERLATE
jgi:hypothetical protein